MSVEPTNDWKVDLVKYGNLRDDQLQVYQEGQNISVIHVPTGINVDADTKPSASENWELAQEALSQALEYNDASWSNPNPGSKPTH
jgi:hypothetical protein